MSILDEAIAGESDNSDESQHGDNQPPIIAYIEKMEPLRSQISLRPLGLPQVCHPGFGLTSKSTQSNSGIFSRERITYQIDDQTVCLPPATNSTDRILRFDSSFESANLYSAAYVSHKCYHLVLESDPPGNCLWFLFKVSKVRRSDITFVLRGFRDLERLFNTGYRVFLHSTRFAAQGTGWYRGGQEYRTGPVDCGSFPMGNDKIPMPYGPVYTHSDLQSSLRTWP